MTRTTSNFAIATALPGMLLGRSASGNQQVPISLIQTYVEQIIASTASNASGAVNFRQAWNATYSYAPNDLVSYNDKIYLMIATQVYMNSTTPDQDSTNWLCLFGQMLVAVDLNTAPNMVFFYSQGANNAPPADTVGYGFTIWNGTGFAVQVFWSSDGGTLYTRALNSGVWSSWAVQAATYQTAQTPGGQGTGSIYASAVNNGEFVSTITVATQLNIAGWANVTGKMQRFRWEIVNGGAYATTWGPYNNLTWIKSDGTTTTDFTTLGITWNAAGSNFFEFSTRDSGTTVWGRALVS